MFEDSCEEMVEKANLKTQKHPKSVGQKAIKQVKINKIPDPVLILAKWLKGFNEEGMSQHGPNHLS